MCSLREEGGLTKGCVGRHKMEGVIRLVTLVIHLEPRTTKARLMVPTTYFLTTVAAA